MLFVAGTLITPLSYLIAMGLLPSKTLSMVLHTKTRLTSKQDLRKRYLLRTGTRNLFLLCCFKIRKVRHYVNSTYRLEHTSLLKKALRLKEVLLSLKSHVYSVRRVISRVVFHV